MKKSIILVIALLCMASLMAAMAFTTADVTSAGEIKITNTNDAVLALVPGSHGNDQDHIFEIRNGEGYFKFGKGYNEVNYGFQPNSVYKYDCFMYVANNTSHPVEFGVKLEGFGAAKKYINISAPGTPLVTNGETDQRQRLSVQGQNNWDYLRHITLEIKVPSLNDNQASALINNLKNGTIIFDGKKTD